MIRVRTNANRHQLVFIDLAVDDYLSLIGGVQPGIEVITLDRYQDGIEQISAVLAKRTEIDCIHLVSHGRSGSLQLGNSLLSLETLPQYYHQLRQWQTALSSEGEILLYGCNVAAGERGISFVKELKSLIGAQIAASTNLTGSSQQGGNWQLQLTTGKIKSALAFSPQLIATYASVFDPPASPQTPSVFCFRFTDIEVVTNDLEQDQFRVTFEVLNWSNRLAGGVRMDINTGINSFTVDNASLITDAETNPNSPLPPGNLPTANNWEVSVISETSVEWTLGANGQPIPGRDLLTAAQNGLEAACALVPGGCQPGTRTPADIEMVDDAENVLNGFVITIDDLDELEAISLNWLLLDEFGEPIGTPGGGNAYGFGTVNLVRLPSNGLTPDSNFRIFPGNAGINSTPALFALDSNEVTGANGDVVALFGSEFGAGITGGFANPENNIFGVTANSQAVPGLAVLPNNILLVRNSGSLIFRLDQEETVTNTVSEVGVFVVDANGAVIDRNGNPIPPGSAGYEQAALENGQVIFSALEDFPGESEEEVQRLFNFEDGDRLLFFFIPDGTTDSVLAGNQPIETVQFGSPLINPGVPQPLQISEIPLSSSEFLLEFDDVSGGNGGEFVLTIEGDLNPIPLGAQQQGSPQSEIIDLQDLPTTANLEATFTVNREAAFDNFLGFYQIDDTNGSIGNLNPGDAGYAEAALQRRILNLDLTVANRQEKTVTITENWGGQLWAPFLIAEGTPEDIISGGSEQIYFPFIAANLDGFDHVRLLGNNTFAFEDVLNGGDRDYNDHVVEVEFEVV